MMKFYSSATLALLAAPVLMASQSVGVDASVRGGQSEQQEVGFAPVTRRFLANQNATGDPLPTQTFFIPLPEDSMFNDMFYQINPKKARPHIESMLSVAISTDNTWIWYDHWEDKYDLDAANPKLRSRTTQIWGDGDANNGCAPGVVPCSHTNDKLMAGNTVVIQNAVKIPRANHALCDNGEFCFDGGDRLQASAPIAVTRGAYPRLPGSLMAGAVEVLETRQWGKHFEAPIGMDIGKKFQAFQFTAFFFMAMHDNTDVTLDDGSKVILDMGEGSMVRVNQADELTSNKPIQVDLITGDVWSYYELRWFSLLPVEKWKRNYVSPVGDSFGKTKVLMYNPGPKQLRATIQYRNSRGRKRSYGAVIEPKQAALSYVIPTDSGAWIDGDPGNDQNFIALSMTDTEWTSADGRTTASQYYDWGFPVVPREHLTSQVLVGWGYACTKNQCNGHQDRSKVWVSPVQDATIYVDYANRGTGYREIDIKALQSVKITDKDHDMSGAVIFATKKDSGPHGDPVDIAAAWGQDASVSYAMQSISMDLGTVVLPFTTVRVSKLVDEAVVSPGQTITYTIRVQNLGQKEVDANTLKVFDTLDQHVKYVEGSTFYASKLCDVDGHIRIPDSSGTDSTKFPLDEVGWRIPVMLPRRGAELDIIFKVTIFDMDHLHKDTIINTGYLEVPDGSPLPFEAVSTLNFFPEVDIQNTVYIGSPSDNGCNNAKESVEGHLETTVSYCFSVTNTGKSFLKDIKITNKDLNYSHEFEKAMILAPGESRTVKAPSKIAKALRNWANVTANPVFSDGTDMAEARYVTDKDDSLVGLLEPDPHVKINNTVYLGQDGGAKCGIESAEYVEDILNTPAIYCFQVTNTGNTFLEKVKITNGMLNFTDDTSIGRLKPGETRMVHMQSTIKKDLLNKAVVWGSPCLSDGTAIPNTVPVTHMDPSQVGKLSPLAKVLIQNTVYVGTGAKCGTAEAVEYVAGFYGTDVTYCLKVINTGETHLDFLEIHDPQLNFTDDTIGKLAPGKSAMLSVPGTIRDRLKNFAKVTAKPYTADGRKIEDLKDVTCTDPSEVGKLANAPAVEIENTVYLGHDGPNPCSTSDAVEHVVDYPGNTVTYCFAVKNTGDTFLDEITITNEQLGILDEPLKVDGILKPGVSKTIIFESTIDGHLNNSATVNANPVLDNGEDIPGLADVTDSDPSSVGERNYAPIVSIENLVYLIDPVDDFDDGSRCDIPGEAHKKVVGKFGDHVRYCFNVSNTGDTKLDGFQLKNSQLKYADKEAINVLAPGESKMVSHRCKIKNSEGNEENVVEVIATPRCADGTQLLSPNYVTDTDPSEVVAIPFDPVVTIDNKVYLGDDDGKSCDTAVEMVEDIHSTAVIYCFTVTNNGNTSLDEIVINNKELLVKDLPIPRLAPGKNFTVSIPRKIQQNLTNHANVTAQPVLHCGDSIPRDKVEATDPSEVRKLDFKPSVKVENTVYLGQGSNVHNSCGDMKNTVNEYVEGKYNTAVTYCFKVLNDGNTFLSQIDLSNGELYYFTRVNETLAPGKHTFAVFPSIIFSALSNQVNVTATPVMDDGRIIPDADRVKWDDSSQVGRIMHAPEVVIENTVYLGDGDCANANDFLEANYGSQVTYCLIVRNRGDTFLDDIIVEVKELDFYDDEINPLGPGNSTLLTVPRRITGDLSNSANVTATPVMPDGKEIPSQGDVTHIDASEVGVVAHEPSININNTVVLGSDGSCNDADEHVDDYPDSPVKYCVMIKNTGDSYLSGVKVRNDKLTYPAQQIDILGPGQSYDFTLPATIDGDLTNVATVVAIPVLEDGTKIPDASDVSDDDASSVGELQYSPEITIDNTVYLGTGTDDDNKCGTNDARDLVEGIYGTSVTYCFVVINTGTTFLNEIVVTNKDLDEYSNDSIGKLAPGANATLILPSSIAGDLRNNATVTGNPVLEDGIDIPHLDDVSSDDTSGVVMIAHAASVKIKNRVYVGVEEDKKCGTAQNTTEGIFGTDVVFCFIISNTGDTFLNEIKVENEKLNYSNDTFPLVLGPGENVTLTVPKNITGDDTNTVVVTANPILEDGTDIPDLVRVYSEDPSGVEKLDLKAEISIDNTVILGDDKESCAEATDETVTDVFGAPVLYCLSVRNTGETLLKRVEVVNEDISYSHSIGDLPAGESVLLPVQRTIRASGKNKAAVTGNPTLDDGTDIPHLDDVSSDDTSGVVMIAHAASVKIKNKVYLGSDGEGKGCKRAGKYVENFKGAGVTYCFQVKNTGLSYLCEIKIVNEKLPFSDTDYEPIPLLGPDESTTIAFPTNINGALRNNATVFAKACLKTGEPIPLIDDCTDIDGSEVGELDYHPNVNIKNTVYLGNDGGISCSSGVERLTTPKGSDVTYCFNVTNTGTTYLNDVVVINKELNFTDNSIGLLAPGDSEEIALPATIEKPLINNAVVTANPVLSNEADIAGAEDVTSTDPSEVDTPSEAPTAAPTASDGISGDNRSGDKDPYAPPDGPQGCIQNKWKDAGKEGDLVCATKEVFLESLAASEPLICVAGEIITITIEASMSVGSSKNDLGWYVATDGGDAMDGTCVVNGLQEPNEYAVMDSNSTPVGDVTWIDVDDDECGDILVSGSGGTIDIPFAVETELPCTDENEDGSLDFAVCFTWRTGSNNDACTFSTNIPGDITGGCFCTRYDVTNIEVNIPIDDPFAPC